MSQPRAYTRFVSVKRRLFCSTIALVSPKGLANQCIAAITTTCHQVEQINCISRSELNMRRTSGVASDLRGAVDPIFQPSWSTSHLGRRTKVKDDAQDPRESNDLVQKCTAQRHLSISLCGSGQRHDFAEHKSGRMSENGWECPIRTNSGFRCRQASGLTRNPLLARMCAAIRLALILSFKVLLPLRD